MVGVEEERYVATDDLRIVPPCGLALVVGEVGAVEPGGFEDVVDRRESSSHTASNCGLAGVTVRLTRLRT